MSERERHVGYASLSSRVGERKYGLVSSIAYGRCTRVVFNEISEQLKTLQCEQTFGHIRFIRKTLQECGESFGHYHLVY